MVNSAGIARRAKVDETDMADFDAVMAVNVRGAFLVSKYALPHLRAYGGAILHLSSGVATTGRAIAPPIPPARARSCR